VTGPIPAHPKIFHITHVGNLSRIIADDRLWSDARRLELGVTCEVVGMSSIKERRLNLDVDCHPGTKVGQYVPFYFCPRSIMLFILYKRNHPELTYRGGQTPIVHLQADLRDTVGWAEANGIRWAFCNANAGAYYRSFRCNLDRLGEINWDAVAATDSRDALTQDGKQAEFLVFDSFPWQLVEKIGVVSDAVQRQAEVTLTRAGHQPLVQVEPGWYF
jgi:ssDNA thymidine ADP-ribosyltransferase, DarT